MLLLLLLLTLPGDEHAELRELALDSEGTEELESLSSESESSSESSASDSDSDSSEEEQAGSG